MDRVSLRRNNNSTSHDARGIDEEARSDSTKYDKDTSKVVFTPLRHRRCFVVLSLLALTGTLLACAGAITREALENSIVDWSHTLNQRRIPGAELSELPTIWPTHVPLPEVSLETIDKIIMPRRMKRLGWTWRPTDEAFLRQPPCSLEEILAWHPQNDSLQDAPHYDPVAQRCDCGRTAETAGGRSCEGLHPGEEQVQFPKFSFVTAIADIGRTSRSVCKYLKYMARGVLRIRENITVYGAKNTLHLIAQIRERYGLLEKTDLQIMSSLNDLPFFTEMRPGMYDAVLRRGWKFQQNPAIQLPEYCLINHAKFGFLKDVLLRNHFKSDYFVWIDSGGGHGDVAYWQNWCPCAIASKGPQFTVFTVSGLPSSKDGSTDRSAPIFSNESFDQDFMTVPLPQVTGTFFGGDSAGVLEMYDAYKELMEETTRRGFVCSDQCLLRVLYYRMPKLLRWHSHMDWYSFPRLC